MGQVESLFDFEFEQTNTADIDAASPSYTSPLRNIDTPSPSYTSSPLRTPSPANTRSPDDIDTPSPCFASPPRDIDTPSPSYTSPPPRTPSPANTSSLADKQRLKDSEGTAKSSVITANNLHKELLEMKEREYNYKWQIKQFKERMEKAKKREENHLAEIECLKTLLKIKEQQEISRLYEIKCLQAEIEQRKNIYSRSKRKRPDGRDAYRSDDQGDGIINEPAKKKSRSILMNSNWNRSNDDNNVSQGRKSVRFTVRSLSSTNE